MAVHTGSALPPGASDSTFARAFTALTRVVGAENVHAGDSLADYQDPYSFSEPGAYAPSAAVLPASVDELQAVIAVANEHQIPLWTVSRGRNFGYGGAAPRVRGSVVADLSRLNRVLTVDEDACYALVEPGVSFADLHQHLRDIGSALWVSVPELSRGSVIGNALERGFGYTNAGDHSAQICGMEVVLADGRMVRTGMGAMTGNAAWQMYKGGYGPSLDGLFLQSNYDTVTKMGVWLTLPPDRAIVCTAKARNEGDLAPLIDTLRPLLLDGTIQSNFMVGNALATASMITDRNQWYDGPGAMPDSVVRTLCDKLDLGWWNARCALYGTEELAGHASMRCAAPSAASPVWSSRCGRIPGHQCHPTCIRPIAVSSAFPARTSSAWRLGGGGDPAHTDFSLVCPPKGADAVRQAQLIRRRVEEYGFDYAGGFTTFPRHGIALALVSFDKSDPEQKAAVGQMFPQLVADAAAAGYVLPRACDVHGSHRGPVRLGRSCGTTSAADNQGCRRPQRHPLAR
jgi:4-cresol dehydrogenase (hydroxylating) flavoprotein subunit